MEASLPLIPMVWLVKKNIRMFSILNIHLCINRNTFGSSDNFLTLLIKTKNALSAHSGNMRILHSVRDQMEIPCAAQVWISSTCLTRREQTVFITRLMTHEAAMHLTMTINHLRIVIPVSTTTYFYLEQLGDITLMDVPITLQPTKEEQPISTC